jgi:hypothetical protein
VLVDGEPVSTADEAEDVVEGVILHHDHDDVLDLRHLVAADRSPGKRQ